MRLPPVLAALTLALVALPATAQTATPRRVNAPHTVVEFIVDRQPDATTREVWAGLRFELEQDWHIYWVNPGDSGGPPYVLWQAAPGITTGEFEWPVPERIPLGPLVNYGYTNEVVLPFRISLAKAGSGATLGGQVKWLICKDICIPGQTQLSLTLPLADGDRGRVAAWKSQIEEARRRVPAPAPAAWRPRVSATGTEFVLTLTLDKPAASASFFPLETSVIDDVAPQAVAGNGHELTLRLKKSESLKADQKRLRGVVVLKSGVAHAIDVPLGGGR